MARKAVKQVPQPTPPTCSAADEQKDLSTLSVRFNHEQRDLLTRAAELRGWTPDGRILEQLR